MPIDFDYLFSILARLVVLFTCIPAHECAHGWVAHRLGDDTAKNQGRLTLNPLRHFDLLGTLSLVLLGFGWAKPVPIDSRFFKGNQRRGIALTAIAGPAANLLMALVILLLYKALYIVFVLAGAGGIAPAAVLTVLRTMVLTNISLGVFNLLPINPLDGSRIFGVLLPEKWYWFLMRYERYIFFVLLLALVTGVLDGPIRFLADYVLRGMNWATSFMDVLLRVIAS